MPIQTIKTGKPKYNICEKHSNTKPKTVTPRTMKAKEKQAAVNAILEAMGDFGSGLKSIFECMEIAEEEILAAQKKYPNRSQAIWQSFKYLQPSELLDPLTPKLYRAHAKEIIHRIAQGKTKKEELEAATGAELCCIFCTVSQTQSLQADAVAAYQSVFNQVFPNTTFFDDLAIQESYPGRVEEIIAGLREKYRQPRQ